MDPYGNKERGYVEVLNLLNIPLKKGEEPKCLEQLRTSVSPDF